ncbi:uncharacterized protein LOC135364545 isoform X6 [Mirounga angustirostris]|uniref:uncharacterized protein LOC135364545 isoform X6 n=1 Tax=Mirounga angustirostris TaxID=9716 RepID=UPI00313D9C6C
MLTRSKGGDFREDHNPKRFPPFARDWDMQKMACSLHKRGRRSNSEKRNAGLVWTCGASCLPRCFLLQFGKYLPSCHQLVYRSSQGLVPSLNVSRGPKSPFPGIWQHKVWLAVCDKGLSREVEENLCGGVFSNGETLQVARCDDQGSKLCHSPWNEDQAGFHRERHPLLRRPGLLPPFILTSVTQIVRYCVGGAGVLGWPCRLGSTGLLLQIIDDKGNSLPFNTEGNIGIRTKPTKPIGLFMGYEDNPVKTAKVECGDFYNSGDRATMDEEGYIWFLGRNDDIINASGLYTWLPLPLSLHSGSALQVVKAFIVLTPEFLSHDRDQLTKELQQHVKSVPAPCKYPRKHSYGHRLGRPSSLKESSPGSQSCSAEMVPVYKKFTHGLWMWTDIRR